MKRPAPLFAFALVVPAFLAGCPANDDPFESDEGEYTSASARLLDFEFDGEVQTADPNTAQSTIQAQMLFTIGQLNGKTGVGRLDKLALSNVKATPQDGGLTKVTYHAKLPVSMSKATKFGKTY